MNTTIRMALLAILATGLIHGCTAMRGYPKNFIDKSVYDEGGSLSITKATIEHLLSAPDAETRNKILLGMMTSIDLQYHDFRTSLVANQKHFLSGMDALQLGANVASALTGSIGVKENYDQLSILLLGTKNIVDSNYLFKQTIWALLGKMDEQRANKYTEVLGKLGQDTNQYPSPQALQDTIAYYQAGTLTDAVIELTKTASKDAAAGERAKSDAIKLRSDDLNRANAK